MPSNNIKQSSKLSTMNFDEDPVIMELSDSEFNNNTSFYRKPEEEVENGFKNLFINRFKCRFKGKTSTTILGILCICSLCANVNLYNKLNNVTSELSSTKEDLEYALKTKERYKKMYYELQPSNESNFKNLNNALTYDKFLEINNEYQKAKQQKQ